MNYIDKALNGYFRNEECADFINSVFYGGREFIKPDDFLEQDPVVTYIYKENNVIKGDKRERDFLRMVRVADTYYVFVGLEHQSYADPIMPLNDEEALEEYLQRKDLNIDQPTADVINSLVGSDLYIDEKEDVVSMKSAYSRILDRYKEEAREEGREEGIVISLMGLYDEDVISKPILLQSAKTNGVLNLVLEKLDATE